MRCTAPSGPRAKRLPKTQYRPRLGWPPITATTSGAKRSASACATAPMEPTCGAESKVEQTLRCSTSGASAAMRGQSRATSVRARAGGSERRSVGRPSTSSPVVPASGDISIRVRSPPRV